MRYALLVLLNAPLIFLALLNLLTRLKLHKISKQRFRMQFSFWIIVLILLIGSFPVYNAVFNRPPFDANELSILDIIQTTSLVLLFYMSNNQRQKLDNAEKRLRDLHQELSIKLSSQK